MTAQTANTETTLTIPPAAFAALMDEADVPMRDYVRAIAAPVVAAELRRFADAATGGLIPNYTAACTVARALRARAEQLDPKGM